MDKPYKDIPGTIIFDAEQSRKGYHINQFCMSLMKAENRERFKADERAYLDEWPMTEDQKVALLARDLNRCLELGGNIYFLAKLGGVDGKSFGFERHLNRRENVPVIVHQRDNRRGGSSGQRLRGRRGRRVGGSGRLHKGSVC